MIAYVLDACAVFALFQKHDPGHGAMQLHIKAHGKESAIHSLNLFEVYSKTMQKKGGHAAQLVLDQLSLMGVTVVEELPATLWQDGAWIRATYGLYLADAIAWATARHFKATLVTADHHGFEGPMKANVAKIYLFR